MKSPLSASAMSFVGLSLLLAPAAQADIAKLSRPENRALKKLMFCARKLSHEPRMEEQTFSLAKDLHTELLKTEKRSLQTVLATCEKALEEKKPDNVATFTPVSAPNERLDDLVEAWKTSRKASVNCKSYGLTAEAAVLIGASVGAGASVCETRDGQRFVETHAAIGLGLGLGFSVTAGRDDDMIREGKGPIGLELSGHTTLGAGWVARGDDNHVTDPEFEQDFDAAGIGLEMSAFGELGPSIKLFPLRWNIKTLQSLLKIY